MHSTLVAPKPKRPKPISAIADGSGIAELLPVRINDVAFTLAEQVMKGKLRPLN